MSSHPPKETPPAPKDGSPPSILVTSALPYVNNVPHLGNLIGSTLSADVYARFKRKRGDNVLYVCGTDEYGTATETRAREEGVTPRELCDRFHEVHRGVYEWFGIGFDVFGRTTTEVQTEIAQGIFHRLEEEDMVVEKDTEQLRCDTCEMFLADRFVEGECPYCGYEDARGDQCDACQKLINATDLKNPRCKACSATPSRATTRHVFLDLPRLETELRDWYAASSVEGQWPANAVQATKAWLDTGLRERCITRDLKWGTPVPRDGFRDKVFYVWFDAPIGYISMTAGLTDEWRRWWHNPDNVRLVQFLGKDNIPFHTVIFPGTLLGTRDPWTKVHHVSTTEYLNYERGKFSKSRGTGVFGDAAQECGIPAELWRYYLLATRPEGADSVFQWGDFQARCNNELLANLGNFLNRVLKFCADKLGEAIPALPADPCDADAAFERDLQGHVATYISELEAVHLRRGLEVVMEASGVCNRYFQAQKPWDLLKAADDDSMARCRDICAALFRAAHLIANLAEPFVPQLSDKAYAQMGVGPAATREDWSLASVAVPEGHILDPAKVAGLVPKIPAKLVESLSERFGGPRAVEFPLDVRVGVVEACDPHPDPSATELYVLKCDVAGKARRQIVSGLARHYADPAELVGKRVVLLCNLKPRKFKGISSQGMLLTGIAEDGTVRVLEGPASAAAGAKIVPEETEVVPAAKLDLKTFQALDNVLGEDGAPVFLGKHRWVVGEDPVTCGLPAGSKVA